MRERSDGNYEVLLHEARYSPEATRWEPTGKQVRLTVTPDLPVNGNRPREPALGGSGDARVAWPSIAEKALAGVEHTWTAERRAQWEKRWAIPGRPDLPAPAVREYNRLDQGSTAGDRAELLVQLTGQPAAVRSFPKDIDMKDDRHIDLLCIAEEFRTLLAAHKPILVGTRSKRQGETELPHDLQPSHAYEVVNVDDDNRIYLRNPWNQWHPEPITPKQFMDNIRPQYTTLEK